MIYHMRKDIENRLLRRSNEKQLNIIIGAIGVIFVLVGVVFLKKPNVASVLFGIGGSLIASAVVAYLTSIFLFKRQMEKEITETWGVFGFWESRAQMNQDCDLYLENAKNQIDYVGFGFRSLLNSKYKVLEAKAKQGVKIRFLVMSPSSRFIKEREVEEHNAPGEISQAILILEDAVNKLKTVAAKPENIEIRFYDAMPLDYYNRIDDVIFTGPYWLGKQSQQTVSFGFQGNTKGFHVYSEYFEDLWNNTEFVSCSHK